MSGFVKRFSPILLISIVFIVSFLLIWGRSMQKEYNRDENQFIASGELLADQGLLPYRDYPYFHMPNLVFVYALIDTFSEYSLLSARAFSVVCAVLALGIIFLIAYRVFPNHRPYIRITIAVGAVILLLANPIFEYTSGSAWNHDLPVLLVLTAFIVFVHGVNKDKPVYWILASGILVGLATGTRLSFLLAGIPFVLAIFYVPHSAIKPKRRMSLLAFCLGMTIGLLPAIFLFAFDPQKFIFGNFVYAELNTSYREETAYKGPMTLLEKWEYMQIEIMQLPGNLILFLATIFFAFTMGVIQYREKSIAVDFILILLLIVFLAISSFLPTPAFYQYFYAPVPFAIVGILYGLANASELLGRRGNWAIILYIQMVVILGFFLMQDLSYVIRLKNLESWYPLSVHQIGKEIQILVPQGKILTLTPIYPLDGGGEIYRDFATGPFAWRTAHFLTEEERDKLEVVSEDDLQEFLVEDPPAAILVGMHPGVEAMFIEFAQQNGYREVEITNKLSLWLP
jgi:4-amino-4-deoxy-L-arabinose transferase-like glycosyltransferase